MMIPTISIDGVSLPVSRDGANLACDMHMPLAVLAGQVLEQGAAFEIAVEQFQQAMAELPVLPVGTDPVQAQPQPQFQSIAPQPTIAVPVEHPSAQMADLQIDHPTPPPLAVAQERVLPVKEAAVSAVAADEELPEVPVLQAAPLAALAQPQVIDVRRVAVEPVQVVAARVAHQVMATPAQVLVEAASAVADTIVVSPGLLRGAGEIQVQLRPDVLEGTVIGISTTSPGELTVNFTPATENMAVMLEKCASQLVTYLSERIHNFQIAVNVKRDDKVKG